MKLIEIPFNPNGTSGWVIPIPGDGEKQFPSRENALAFALEMAKGMSIAEGEAGLLCVQGADKQWRLFTPDLKPLKPHA